VGVQNVQVPFASAAHDIWVRRVRIFDAASSVILYPFTGQVECVDPYVAPVAQVDTATAAGTITTAGNASVTVTSAAFGAPVAVTFAVALGDTAAVWAGKARAALAAHSQIKAKFAVSGSSTAIVLTRLIDDAGVANDSSLNIALADVTSAGITEAATSANTTNGSAATGALVNDADAVGPEDAEGEELQHFEGSIRGFLCQGVRGGVIDSDDEGFRGTVYAGGFAAAGCNGEDQVLTNEGVVTFTAPEGLGEVVLVLVTQ
jgi:hypothetical protein